MSRQEMLPYTLKRRKWNTSTLYQAFFCAISLNHFSLSPNFLSFLPRGPFYMQHFLGFNEVLDPGLLDYSSHLDHENYHLLHFFPSVSVSGEVHNVSRGQHVFWRACCACRKVVR